jgi:AcrR family transcriptional regulator
MMRKRSETLREHILFTAQDVFLESGFERASMDIIAARAETTKKTLYAHFENKENLFLAVIELIRGYLINQSKTPAEYSEDTEQALVMFCGRFLEKLLWNRSIRMSRLSMVEAERFPHAAAQLYEATFGMAQERLESFLIERMKCSDQKATQTAEALLGRVLHPRFTRALCGLGEITDEWLDDEHLSAQLDLEPIRRAVAELMLKFNKST